MNAVLARPLTLPVMRAPNDWVNVVPNRLRSWTPGRRSGGNHGRSKTRTRSQRPLFLCTACGDGTYQAVCCVGVLKCKHRHTSWPLRTWGIDAVYVIRICTRYMFGHAARQSWPDRPDRMTATARRRGALRWWRDDSRLRCFALR